MVLFDSDASQLAKPQLRHVSSPAVSTGTPSLLRNVRASAKGPQLDSYSRLAEALVVRCPKK